MKSLEGLSLINLKIPKKLSHPKVVHFYKTLPFKKVKKMESPNNQNESIDDFNIDEVN